MRQLAAMLLAGALAAAVLTGCGGPSTDELVNRAVADFQVGRVDRAKVLLGRALDRSPSHPLALFYMARIHHAEKSYEQAIYYYQCCLDADPSNAAARKHLAEALKAAGAVGEALRFIPEPMED